MMNWFHRAIDRGVQEGVTKALTEFCAPGGGLEVLVEDSLWNQMEASLSKTSELTRLGFVWALRLCFVRHGTSRTEAIKLANATLSQYLEDEKIGFSDPAYGWTRSDADDLADEYEFRHWEAA